MPIYVKEFMHGEKCRIMMIGKSSETFLLEEFIREYKTDPQYDVPALIALMDRFSNTGRIIDDRKVRKLHESGGLFEFKTPRGMRVTWAWSKGYVVICGYCFIKKGDKTPKRFIETSVEWIEAYRDAENTHEIREIK